MCRGNRIGECSVYREGLYYRFICRCDVAFEKVYCLYVQIGEQCENLGVLVPVDGGFGFSIRLPAKRFQTGMPVFYAAAKQGDTPRKFIPIYPEEPFAYLKRITDCCLARRDGQIGVMLPDYGGESPFD